MKKEILSNAKTMVIMSWIYCIMVVLIVMFGSWTLIGVGCLIIYKTTPMLLLYLEVSMFAIVMVSFFLFRHLFRNHAKETNYVEPYVIQLNCKWDRNICDYLVQKVSMQQLPNGCYSSYVKGRHGFLFLLYQNLIQTLFKVQPPKGIYRPFVRGKQDILFLLYQLSAYDEKSYTNICFATNEYAWEKYGIKKKMSREEAKQIGRINLILLDKMTEDALEAARCNPAYGLGINCPLGFIDIFIDLESSKLYIPRLLSLMSNQIYLNFMKVIMELFEIED